MPGPTARTPISAPIPKPRIPSSTIGSVGAKAIGAPSPPVPGMLDGIGDHLKQNWPLYAGGGLGLYALYDLLRAKEPEPEYDEDDEFDDEFDDYGRGDVLDAYSLRPRYYGKLSAALDTLTQDCPRLAGFLQRCGEDQLDDAQIQKRLKFACAVDAELKQELTKTADGWAPMFTGPNAAKLPTPAVPPTPSANPAALSMWGEAAKPGFANATGPAAKPPAASAAEMWNTQASKPAPFYSKLPDVPEPSALDRLGGYVYDAASGITSGVQGVSDAINKGLGPLTGGRVKVDLVGGGERLGRSVGRAARQGLAGIGGAAMTTKGVLSAPWAALAAGGGGLYGLAGELSGNETMQAHGYGFGNSALQTASGNFRDIGALPRVLGRIGTNQTDVEVPHYSQSVAEQQAADMRARGQWGADLLDGSRPSWLPDWMPHVLPSMPNAGLAAIPLPGMQASGGLGKVQKIFNAPAKIMMNGPRAAVAGAARDLAAWRGQGIPAAGELARDIETVRAGRAAELAGEVKSTAGNTAQSAATAQPSAELAATAVDPRPAPRDLFGTTVAGPPTATPSQLAPTVAEGPRISPSIDQMLDDFRGELKGWPPANDTQAIGNRGWVMDADNLVDEQGRLGNQWLRDSDNLIPNEAAHAPGMPANPLSAESMLQAQPQAESAAGNPLANFFLGQKGQRVKTLGQGTLEGAMQSGVNNAPPSDMPELDLSPAELHQAQAQIDSAAKQLQQHDLQTVTQKAQATSSSTPFSQEDKQGVDTVAQATGLSEKDSRGVWQGMSDGERLLTVLGFGLGTVALISAMSGGDVDSWILAALGFAVGGGALAHGGMFGGQAQGAVKNLMQGKNPMEGWAAGAQVDPATLPDDLAQLIKNQDTELQKPDAKLFPMIERMIAQDPKAKERIEALHEASNSLMPFAAGVARGRLRSFGVSEANVPKLMELIERYYKQHPQVAAQ